MTSRSAPRRRQTLRESHAVAQRNGSAVTPKVINAGPSLEKAELYGIHDQRSTHSKLMGLAGRIFIETIPQWLTVGAMLGLIFGGCCSNVCPRCPINPLLGPTRAVADSRWWHRSSPLKLSSSERGPLFRLGLCTSMFLTIP